MAGWQDNSKNKSQRQSKFGPRLLAAIIGFCTVFVLSYVSTNVGRQQRFPHPSVTCPSALKSWITSTKKPKLQVLLLSYPRSGSSFLGDLLQSYKGAFYHFEPLHYFGGGITRHLTSARKLIRDLFTCDYRDWDSFPEWAWFHRDYLTLRRNKRYWEACTNKDRSRLLCYSVCFLASVCQYSPVQIIKTIRMPMSEAAKLLEESKDLNMKIVHLVRDPRGAINSRQQKDIAVWCSKYKECSSPDAFCRLVDEDLKNGCSLQQRHPDKYILVRYEDLAFDPPKETERLFNFLGIGDVPDEVAEFLETHTRGSPSVSTNSFLQPPYRTERNSSQAALEWSRHMKLKNILQVQRHCHPVLDRLGYSSIYNRTGITAQDILTDMPKNCETM